MPNELVRLRDGGDSDGNGKNGHRNGAMPLNAMGYGADTSEEWDLPPEQMGYGFEKNAGPEHGPQIQRAASLADDDAVRARRRGDTEFASVRESDAADLRQTMWDWGDLKTWVWFGGMCLVFLLMVALCYFLPYGRHASPPPIRVY